MKFLGFSMLALLLLSVESVLVKSFGLASPASALTSYNGGLYFKGTTGLWKSDGTADGTQLFKAF